MFSFDEYEYDRVFRQEQGITIFNQLGRVFIGQTVQPGTKKTVRVRKDTSLGAGAVQGLSRAWAACVSLLAHWSHDSNRSRE